MSLDLTMIQVITRPLESVEYTEQNAEAVRQWVQDTSTFQEIVRDATSGRLYIPIGEGTLDIVEYGEFLIHEPGTGNFRSVTPEAYHEFYERIVS